MPALCQVLVPKRGVTGTSSGYSVDILTWKHSNLEAQNKGRQSLVMMCQDSGCEAYPAPGEDAGGRHAHVEVVHIRLDFL